VVVRSGLEEGHVILQPAGFLTCLLKRMPNSQLRCCLDLGPVGSSVRKNEAEGIVTHIWNGYTVLSGRQHGIKGDEMHPLGLPVIACDSVTIRMRTVPVSPSQHRSVRRLPADDETPQLGEGLHSRFRALLQPHDLVPTVLQLPRQVIKHCFCARRAHPHVG
jgi:hypothetical protein